MCLFGIFEPFLFLSSLPFQHKAYRLEAIGGCFERHLFFFMQPHNHGGCAVPRCGGIAGKRIRRPRTAGANTQKLAALYAEVNLFLRVCLPDACLVCDFYMNEPKNSSLFGTK